MMIALHGFRERQYLSSLLLLSFTSAFVYTMRAIQEDRIIALLSAKGEAPAVENDSPAYLLDIWRDNEVPQRSFENGCAEVPDEGVAQQRCQLSQYDPGEFKQREVNVIDGLRLGHYDPKDGLAATFYIHDSCSASTKSNFFDTKRRPTLMSSNGRRYALRLPRLPEKKKFVSITGDYVSTGYTLHDILRGAPYTWLECGRLGSHLIVQPPTGVGNRNKSTQVNDQWDRKSRNRPLVKTVISIMLDALSREKMRVILPKTQSFLEQACRHNSSTHVAVPLLRHSIVGFNSPPNKVAVYSGQRVEQFSPDDATWVWDVAEDEGFVVASAENGINGAESIRAGRTEEQTSSESLWGDMPHWYAKRSNATIGTWRWPTAALGDILHVGRKPKNPARRVKSACKFIGRAKYSLADGSGHFSCCAGNIAITKQKLDYINDFLIYNKAPRKAAFLSFDDPHYPGEHPLRLDSDLSESLRRWTTTGDANQIMDAAIVVWGDHGLHFSNEFETSGGRSAHRQPAAWVLLPKSLIKQNRAFYSALVSNAQSLTSHWDMHLTLLHLLTGKTHPNMTQAEGTTRGKSLFLHNKPRDCEEAGIRPEFCPCYRNLSSSKMPARHEILGSIAEHMNRATASHEERCMYLGPEQLRERDSTVIHRIEPTNADMTEYNQPKHARDGYDSMNELQVILKLEVRVEEPDHEAIWTAVLTASENTGKVLDVSSLRAVSDWQSKWDVCKEKHAIFAKDEISRKVKEICICA